LHLAAKVIGKLFYSILYHIPYKILIPIYTLAEGIKETLTE